MPNDVQLSLLIQLFQRIKKVSKKKKPPSLFFFSRKYLEPVEGGVDSPIFFKVRWNNLAIINKSDFYEYASTRTSVRTKRVSF